MGQREPSVCFRCKQQTAVRPSTKVSPTLFLASTGREGCEASSEGAQPRQPGEERGAGRTLQGMRSHPAQVLPGERGLLHGIRARHVWTQHCGTVSLETEHTLRLHF